MDYCIIARGQVLCAQGVNGLNLVQIYDDEINYLIEYGGRICKVLDRVQSVCDGVAPI